MPDKERAFLNNYNFIDGVNPFKHIAHSFFSIPVVACFCANFICFCCPSIILFSIFLWSIPNNRSANIITYSNSISNWNMTLSIWQASQNQISIKSTVNNGLIPLIANFSQEPPNETPGPTDVPWGSYSALKSSNYGYVYTLTENGMNTLDDTLTVNLLNGKTQSITLNLVKTEKTTIPSDGKCPEGYSIQGSECISRTVVLNSCFAYDDVTNSISPCFSNAYNFQTVKVNTVNTPITGSIVIRHVKDPYITLYNISPTLTFGPIIGVQYAVGIITFLIALVMPCCAVACLVILVVSCILVILLEAFLFFEGGVPGFLVLVKAGHFIEIIK
jgi:hypothetical protein